MHGFENLNERCNCDGAGQLQRKNYYREEIITEKGLLQRRSRYREVISVKNKFFITICA